MRPSKRERRRIERARKRKQKAFQAAQDTRHEAHAFRALGAAAAADLSLHEGDAGEALALAREAATLLPRDPSVAFLYFEAAEKARDLVEERKALEHVAQLVKPDAPLLIRLAYLHLETGNADRARELARRGRAVLPRRMERRKQWLGMLEYVELMSAVREARDASDTAPEEQEDKTSAGGEGEPSLFSFAPATARTEIPPATVTAVEQAPAEPARLFEIPVEIDDAVQGLDGLASDVFATPEGVALSTLAATIRDAESYDRLLALENARGVLRLSHQEETARRVLARFLGRALLADEVGLGKTVEAGLVLSEHLLRGRIESALVLVPPSLVGQWREELATKFAIEARTTEEAAFRAAPEAFWRSAGVAVASLPTARNPRHREWVTGRSWDLVIVDEAHLVKNARTESYALVSRIHSRFLLLLTATPVENRVEELYNLVSLIRPGHLGGRSEFLRRYGDRGGRMSEAARREIRSLLGEIMIRNTRALSGVALPPRFAKTVLVEPLAEEGELYDHLVAVLHALGPGGRTRFLLSVLLQEAGSSPYAVAATLEKLRASGDHSSEVLERLAPAIDFAARPLATGKGAALLRVLADHEPAVVFTRFRATLDFLAATLGQAGIFYERMSGEVPAPVRREAIERCREHRGVLVTTDVGAEGLNLQFCRRVVNFDLPWNPMRIEQRIGRVHRIGQEHAVEVVNLCLARSIEERILRILDERINLFELVVGEIEMILGYLEGERDFADIVFDAFADPEEAARERSFARIGDALTAARRRYQGVKSFDEELFRSELGV